MRSLRINCKDRKAMVYMSNTLNIKGYRGHLVIVLIGISVVFSIICELFYFNRAQLVPKDNCIINPILYQDDGSKLIYGQEYSFNKGDSITIPNLDHNVSNYYLGIESFYQDSWSDFDEKRKSAFTILTSITDDGHSIFYALKDIIVSPLVESSLYIPVEPYGKVHDIKITFKTDIDHIVIDKIVLNATSEFKLSLKRIIAVMAIVFLILFVFLYDIVIPTENKLTTLRFAMLVSCVCLICISIFIQNNSSGVNKGYAELAHSFLDGRLYLEENTDEILSDMSNPYDNALRKKLGAEFYWDVAFYNNRYYVYFGAVPVLFFQMPYYLLTGKDMTYLQAHKLIDVLIIVGALCLIMEIRQKYCRFLSIRLTVLIYITFTLSCGLSILIKRSGIYYEAIGTALMLVIWGLFFWYSSVNDNRISIVKGMIGSTLIALSVGARPQFAIVSLAAIYIFRGVFKKENALKIVLLIFPYIPIAILLMSYNYARFGSVLDFGANYNLTTQDMTHMGIHLSRLPMGIWYNLFKLPVFDYSFPFLLADGNRSLYQGYIAFEKQIGGALFLIPYLFLAFRGFLKKNSVGRLVRGASVLAIIVISFDALMGGILVRYQVDFRIVLIIPAVIVNMSRMNTLYKDKDILEVKSYCRLTALLCIVTITLSLMGILCQYESHDYSDLNANPVFYCWLRSVFGG